MHRFHIFVGVSVLLTGALAEAQVREWNPYSVSVYNEGPGFRLGSTALVLHPGAIVEGGYDTNIFYSSRNEQGAGLLRLRAHFDIATLPPQRLEGDVGTAPPKLDFRFSTQIEYREYLSSDPVVQAQRSVNIYAGADMTILPHGPFSLRLFDTYVRTVDPRTQEVGNIVPTGGPNNFSRDFNRVGFTAKYRFGEKIEFGVGDFFQFNFWENPELKFGDEINDEAQAFLRVRFLPQLTGSLVARVGYVNYTNIPQLESIPLRVMAGAEALITSWFGAAAAVGYGNSMHKFGPSLSNAIANVEARFFLPHALRLTLGYDRDFFDTLISNFELDDRLYLGFDMPLLYRLTAHVDGGVRFRHYEGLVSPTILGYLMYSSPVRDDVLYDAHAELGFRAASWVQLALSYNFMADSTNFAFIDMSGAPTSVNFIKHSVFLRADFAY